MTLLYRRPFDGVRRITATKQQHEGRKPPSAEPGIDYYLPVGTPLYMPADGYVRWNGSTTGAAGPKFVGFEHTDGNWIRLLHMSKINTGMGVGTFKRKGDLVGLSGASVLRGIPQPHVHVTMWMQPGARPIPGVTYPTGNFEWFMLQQERNQAAGGGAVPFDPDNPTTPEGFLMALSDDEQKALLDATLAVKKALLDGRPETGYALRPFDQVLTASTDVQARLMAATGGGWDSFDELVKASRILVNRSADEIAAAVAAKIPADPTPEQIAAAVREVFRVDPIK